MKLSPLPPTPIHTLHTKARQPSGITMRAVYLLRLLTPPRFRIMAVVLQMRRPSQQAKKTLARKLRRVASAPNAQGLFSSSDKAAPPRPGSAQLGKEPVIVETGASPKLSMVATEIPIKPIAGKPGAPIPTPGQLRQSIAFRRTYSSNSIKVRNVEVGPSSFDKIKLIGKGDVGKVYLVREKKSNRFMQ